MTHPRRQSPAGNRLQQALRRMSRRRLLATSVGVAGLSLPSLLSLRSQAADAGTPRRAESCIILYCWGGMSHLETWDPKPNAPVEIRGEFSTIATATPGVALSEHMPLLSRHTEKLAIVRSIHHNDSAHGRGMYWNLTGHQPPRAGNIPPLREDWPTLAAMIAKLRAAPRGVPGSVRLPYPMVDNGTLQAGEYGGWLGAEYDPIVMRPQSGEPFGGVSRTLGSQVLQLNDVDFEKVARRRQLLAALESSVSAQPTSRASSIFAAWLKTFSWVPPSREPMISSAKIPRCSRCTASTWAAEACCWLDA